METLKRKILHSGKVLDGNILQVDSFLNHQIDVDLLLQIGKEFHERFGSQKITKILTIEASGIAVACMSAQYFNVPVLFAKKNVVLLQKEEVYETKVFSYTKQRFSTIRIAKEYLNSNDRVLIVDDFLAQGNAILGLAELIFQAGATLCGAGVVIEKGFQNGRKVIMEHGIKLESLAIVNSMAKNKIILE